jgi:hypothetical protein
MLYALATLALHVHGAGRITRHSRTVQLLAKRSKFLANLLSVVRPLNYMITAQSAKITPPHFFKGQRTP